MVAADRALVQAITALSESLRELDAPSMIIGGIAVILHGVPRHTVDIDATLWGEDLDLVKAFETFRRHGLAPRISGAQEFARQHQVLLLRHEPTGTPVDISLGWLPFEKEALEAAGEIQFEGVPLKVVRPEDLVIYKAVAWRERDRTDIERLLVLHGASMDLERIRLTVRRFAEALELPERIGQFEEIVQRAMG